MLEPGVDDFLLVWAEIFILVHVHEERDVHEGRELLLNLLY